MITLKELQKELEALKNNQTVLVEHPPIPKLPLYRRATAPLLFVITSILSYGHKIPMISKLITLLSLWYGKTTWWKMLITLRKIFVVCNALIGVYTVFKVTGFNQENLFMGFYAVGHTYLEMFTSAVSRLFKGLSSFFDWLTPDVPKPPVNPADSWRWGPKEHTWSTRPMSKDGLGKIMDLAQHQEFYHPYKSTVSNDWNISTWLWYAGVAVVTVGILYLGYTFIVGGELADTIAPKTKITPATPPSAPGGVPPMPPIPPVEPDATIINLNDDSNVFTRIGARITNILNPFNYFSTQAQNNNQFNSFIERQYDPTQSQHHLYPFTVENPYLPWYKKLSIAMFGESHADEVIRLRHKDFAFRDYELIKVRMDSPNITSVGLGTHFPFPPDNIWDTHHRIIHNNLERVMKSLPNTPHISPKLTPLNLPDVSGWKEHTVEKSVNPILSKGGEVATSSKVTVEALDEAMDNVIKKSLTPVFGINGSKNKFTVLREENVYYEC